MKLTLEQAIMAESRCIQLYSSALDWGKWSAPRPGRFTPGKISVPSAQEAGQAPRLLMTGAENHASTGIRSPDRPARSESLYRLSYSGPCCVQGVPRIRINYKCLNITFSLKCFDLFNLQLPNDIYIYIYIYICRTAPLTFRCCILYIYSTNIRTEYFKHAAQSSFFPLQNAVYFIMLPFLVPVLFTF